MSKQRGKSKKMRSGTLLMKKAVTDIEAKPGAFVPETKSKKVFKKGEISCQMLLKD